MTIMPTEFKPAEWVHASNIYEVNLRQYTKEGTFAAFSKHLPRLKEMGVEIIWFMPVTPISVKNRKGTLGSYYACSSYVTTNPEFGTIDEFKALIQQIHALGMKVIIDWVANHTGWDHEWTISHPEYYTQDHEGNFKPPVENWEDVIHLNFYNPALRKAMIDAMKFWVTDCGIDGFRCDMAMLVPVDFWAEARRALDRLRPLFWLGEFDQWNDEPFAHVFDVSYTWHWMHVSEEFYKHKKRIVELDKALDGYKHRNPPTHLQSFFTSNHDENSWNGSEYEKYGDLALPLAVFSCTWGGVPLIYSGQELPNTKRLAFFDKDEIEWTGKPRLHLFYQKLLQLRKQHAVFAGKNNAAITWRIATTAPDQVFCFVRKNGDAELLVLLNLSNEPVQCYLHDMRVRGNFYELYSGKEYNSADEFALNKWGYLVLQKA
jgi:glycosidase